MLWKAKESKESGAAPGQRDSDLCIKPEYSRDGATTLEVGIDRRVFRANTPIELNVLLTIGLTEHYNDNRNFEMSFNWQA